MVCGGALHLITDSDKSPHSASSKAPARLANRPSTEGEIIPSIVAHNWSTRDSQSRETAVANKPPAPAQT